MENNLVEDLKNKITKKRIIDYQLTAFNRSYIEIKPADILFVSKILFHDFDARFIIASGFDSLKNIEIFYHYGLDKQNHVITILTKLNREKPAIDSLSSLFDASLWIEREMHELLGIEFKGLSNDKHLLLPDNWPKNNYPLRREVMDD